MSQFAVLASVLSITACMGYVPGRQTYWDAKVKEMCEKDGGLKVFEIAEVSREEYERFRVAPGQGYAIRPEQYSGAAPIVRRTVQTTIRERNPEVWRSEQSAVRRSDGKVLATYVNYARVGGDFPTGIGHHSSYLCPGGPALKIEDVVRTRN